MSPKQLASIALASSAPSEREQPLQPAVAEASRVIALGHGRSLEVNGEQAEHLVLRSPDGELELELVITATGPRLKIRAVDLDLVASRRVSIDCEDLEVRCRRDLSFDVAGDQRVVIGGTARHEAHATTIETRRGDLTMRANDDARVEGERVLLNS